jgi:hypothetical protein
MKRIVKLVAGAMVLACVANTAVAQEDPTATPPLFGTPSFAVLPSFLTSCVISCDAEASNTDFNARFQTVIPTRSPWFALVGGLQWGPASDEAHGPIGFFGPIIPLVPINNATGGWLGLSVDPLLVITGAGGDGMDFVLEGAAVLNFGAMMMKDMPFWSGLAAFFLIDQNITTESGEDSFNPVLIYGLAIPIAP